MIIAKDKSNWSSDTPAKEWAEENNYYIVEDSELANRIMYAFPDFDFLLDDEGNLIDIKTDKIKPTPELFTDLINQNQMLTDCILEMSEIVYGGDM